MTSQSRYIQVAIDVPLMQTFTYKSPNGFSDSNKLPPIGSWVYVPFGRQKLKLALVIGQNQKDNFAKISPNKILPWHSQIPQEHLPKDWIELIKFASKYYHYPIGQVVAHAYPMVIRKKIGLELPKGKIYPSWIKLATDIDEKKMNINLTRKKNIKKLLELFKQKEPIHWQEIKEEYPQLKKTVIELFKQGWLVEEISNKRTQDLAIKLNHQQQKIINDIWQQYCAQPKFLVHLIQGITGSGKTEIYFELCEKVLNQHKQVLILMPEISLTPQLINRILLRFPKLQAEEIAVLHSSIAEGARQRAFKAASFGEAKIIIGTRLAIFTPMKNLGLIVIDEEHDISYKQFDSAFSYSARDLAIYRAKLLNLPIIIGSATPSLESYNHALSNQYRLHQLDSRALSGSKLPTIECINIRGKKLINGISHEGWDLIKKTLENNEQILIFLNRRGYAPIIFCQACGWLAGCESCSTNLVLHRASDSLRCHHCGYYDVIPANCPICGNPDIEMRGIGTQKLEETISLEFPKARIIRIDRDASSSYKKYLEQHQKIISGSVDIIIGTQMMAKGHDFPNLTTVLVLSADMSLFTGEFRASERLFSLLTQVAGRAGRRLNPGRVYIQTACADNPIFKHLINHDYPGFAKDELEQRSKVPVPPFNFQAILKVESKSFKLGVNWLKQHRLEFMKFCPKTVMAYDIVPMRISRKANWDRVQMLIESNNRGHLHHFLKSIVEYLYCLAPSKDIKWWLDVSPLEI